MKTFLVFAIAILLSVCSGSAPTAPANANAPSTSPSLPANSPGPATAGTVTIEAPDGVKLVGSFLPPAKADSPALLLLHQWQSSRHSYDDFAKQMNAKGFAVLSLDGRGFGESTRKADGTTVAAGRSDADVKAMLGDVDAAFNYLSTQPNVDAARVAIVGASYGSSLAIIYSADHPKVAAVALLSPGINYFGNMPTEPAVKKYGSRALYLTAAEDDKESADSVRALSKDGGDSFAVKIYPKGGHGTDLFKVGLDQDLEKFLTGVLAKQ